LVKVLMGQEAVPRLTPAAAAPAAAALVVATVHFILALSAAPVALTALAEAAVVSFVVLLEVGVVALAAQSASSGPATQEHFHQHA
jgi:hypothetical protein